MKRRFTLPLKVSFVLSSTDQLELDYDNGAFMVRFTVFWKRSGYGKTLGWSIPILDYSEKTYNLSLFHMPEKRKINRVKAYVKDCENCSKKLEENSANTILRASSGN